MVSILSLMFLYGYTGVLWTYGLTELRLIIGCQGPVSCLILSWLGVYLRLTHSYLPEVFIPML